MPTVFSPPASLSNLEAAAIRAREAEKKLVDLVCRRSIVVGYDHDSVRTAMATKLSLTVNGQRRTFVTDPDRSLLEVLREDLHLTGTKFGCGEGQCHACTVLVKGQSTRSCITSIGDVAGEEVLTIEGIANGDKLHPVQEVFLSEGAFQCGYCTAGMIMGVIGALNQDKAASGSDVMSQVERHICRCCSYVKYRTAIYHAVAKMAKARA